MKERPVIFNGEMVRAIIDGRKTQTRRIAKADNSNHLLGCPFGQVGDRLWVRETFMDLTGTCIEATTGKFEGFAYRADTPTGSYGDEVRKEYGLKWAPSLHMPRKACRILLEITAVRVERLNDISDGDAISEGCSISDMKSGDCVADVFARLWSSIYGVDSWNANPWVWVIEFRRVGDSAREVEREV